MICGSVKILNIVENNIVFKEEIHTNKIIYINILSISESKYFITIDNKSQIIIWNFVGKKITYSSNIPINNASMDVFTNSLFIR